MAPALGGSQITFLLPTWNLCLSVHDIQVSGLFFGMFLFLSFLKKRKTKNKKYNKLKQTVKYLEIIINLLTTKFLAASEVHLLLAVSGVDLCSLKNATALLRMISPFPAIYFFLEMAVCLLGTGSEDLDSCLQ